MDSRRGETYNVVENLDLTPDLGAESAVTQTAGLVFQRQKDDSKALEELQKASELDPSWGGARLAYADLLVRQGPDVLPKAIAEYEAFLIVSQSEADLTRVRNSLKILKKKLEK